MSNADYEDTLLVHVSTEFMVDFARFVSDCEIIDRSEPDYDASLRGQEARPWEHSTVHRRWRHALKQMGKLVAYTKAGAYGKVRVLRCCFDHGLAFDEDVMVLFKSLLPDLDRVLHDDPDCACQLLSAGLSADC